MDVRAWTVIALLVGLCLPAWASEHGSVTEAELHRLLAVTRPALLPDDLERAATTDAADAAARGAWRCGTPAVLPVLQGWDRLTPAQRALAEQALGPAGGEDHPAFGAMCTVDAANEQESDHFVVKWGASYDGTGVDDLLEALEAARAMFTDALGYREPYGVDGSWKLPVFVGNSGAGIPTISWSGGYTTVCPDHAGAYIVLSQDLGSWEFVADVGPHELYHAVQMGYDAWSVDGWWWEASAVWSQDLTYPDLDGYVWFLSEFTSAPHLMIETEDLRQYGMFIVPMTIEEFVPDGQVVMRELWEQPGTGHVPDALDAILQAGHDSSWADAFAEFAGRAAVMDDYEDGAMFPQPVRAATAGALPDEGTIESNLPQHYGLNFVEIPIPDDAAPPDTKLRFTFDGGGDDQWLLGSVKHRIEDGVHRVWRTGVDDGGGATIEVIDCGTLYDQVVVGVAYTGSGTAPAYSWSAEMVEQTEPQGDDDDAGTAGGGDRTGCLASPSPYAFTAETGEAANACAVVGGPAGAGWLVALGALGAWLIRRRSEVGAAAEPQRRR